MIIKLDAKDYGTGISTQTYLILAAVLIIGVLLIFGSSIIVSLLPLDMTIRGALPFCSGLLGIVVLMVLFTFMYRIFKGMVDMPMKVADKIFDIGIALQAQENASKLTFVSFRDMKGIEIGFNSGGLMTKSHCMIVNKEGKKFVSSENFQDMQKFKEFAGELREILFENGLKLAEEDEGKNHMTYVFVRAKKWEMEKATQEQKS